jgi:hypothetical protein
MQSSIQPSIASCVHRHSALLKSKSWSFNVATGALQHTQKRLIAQVLYALSNCCTANQEWSTSLHQTTLHTKSATRTFKTLHQSVRSVKYQARPNQVHTKPTGMLATRCTPLLSNCSSRTRKSLLMIPYQVSPLPILNWSANSKAQDIYVNDPGKLVYQQPSPN